MTNGNIDRVWSQLRTLVNPGAAAPDRDLIERFVHSREEAAFAALVERHGAMVLGVCRRVLRHQHDAEDACQAAFLVLARKAGSVRNRDALGCWLHGVAYRTAARLKRSLSRQVPGGLTSDVAQPEDADLTWREVRAVLDEELGRLPERFQAPLLLCYLEGKTRDEAAQELGWSLGTLRGRLERGRELLRSRLARRGLTLSGALLSALLTQQSAAGAFPAGLLIQVVQAAVNPSLTFGINAARAAVVAEGVIYAMRFAHWKFAAAIVTAVAFLGLGAGWAVNSAWEQSINQLATPVAMAGAAEPEEDAAAPDEGAAGPQGRKRPVRNADDEGPVAQRLARDMAESRLNLKKLALAMHNFHSVYGFFPPPAIYSGSGKNPFPMVPPGAGMPGGMGEAMGPGGGGPGMMGRPSGGMAPPRGMGAPAGADGGGTGMAGPAMGMGMGGGPMMPAQAFKKDAKPLLSWRVALLPFLEHDWLYQQFRLDEPWDSAHNRQLAKRMPKVFAPPGLKTNEPYTTFYQVFVGPRAGFESHHMHGLASFVDGTSNIILIAEGGHAVPWTKPEDLSYAADEPLPELGGLFPKVFQTAFADGAVHVLDKKADPALLRLAILRDDGRPINLARLKAAMTRRETELRQENDKLRAALDQETARLEVLRREKEIQQELGNDLTNRALEDENQQLQQELEKIREEADRLRQELQRRKPIRK